MVVVTAGRFLQWILLVLVLSVMAFFFPIVIDDFVRILFGGFLGISEFDDISTAPVIDPLTPFNLLLSMTDNGLLVADDTGNDDDDGGVFFVILKNGSTAGLLLLVPTTL